MKDFKMHIDVSEVLRLLGYKKFKDHPLSENCHADSHTDSLADSRSDFRTDSHEKDHITDFSTPNSFSNSLESDSLAFSQILNGINAIQNTVEAKYLYRVFDLIKNEEGFFSLKGTSLIFKGKDAEKLFETCNSCILLAVTLGQKADMLIKKSQIRNMAEAVVLDSCASCGVENICQQINDELEEEYLNKGLYLTDRFSPGYGDMPLSLQNDICQLLETHKRIGLTTMPSLLLTPTKSITAVIGISNIPQPKRITGCLNCRLKKSCAYRKAGNSCER